MQAGTPSGDFSTARLRGWYPDDPVWFVTFDHPRIATIVELEGSDVAVGLTGRSRRQQDHEERRIVDLASLARALPAEETCHCSR